MRADFEREKRGFVFARADRIQTKALVKSVSQSVSFFRMVSGPKDTQGAITQISEVPETC